MGKKKKRGRIQRRKLWWFLLLPAVLLAYVLISPDSGVFAREEYFFIRTGSGYEAVREGLLVHGIIKDINAFDRLAKEQGYPQKVKPGRYRLKKGSGCKSVLRVLASGEQEPVILSLKKIRSRHELMQVVAANLEADTTVLHHIMTDSIYLAQYNLDSRTALCALMPGKYLFLWNEEPEQVFRKIAQQFVHFWNNRRLQQARALKLEPAAVITLASIVEEETNKARDLPLIASVYLNRLKKGMRLQADPTARFAGGDFSIRRITGEQTSIVSPYNTYKVSGLPPGPICTPSPASIDAVLNAPATQYLYFCARSDFSGYSCFASSLKEHNTNARRYQAALNKRGIH